MNDRKEAPQEPKEPKENKHVKQCDGKRSEAKEAQVVAAFRQFASRLVAPSDMEESKLKSITRSKIKDLREAPK